MTWDGRGNASPLEDKVKAKPIQKAQRFLHKKHIMDKMIKL